MFVVKNLIFFKLLKRDIKESNDTYDDEMRNITGSQMLKKYVDL